MSVLPLRRIVLTACTLVLLSSCGTSKTETTVSEGSTDSTALTTDTLDAAGGDAEGGTEDAVPDIAGQAGIDLAAIVAAVNETAGEQSVDNTIIDTVVGKLQADGKIDPANWEVDLTPDTGAAFKFASGTDREMPYCVTSVGVDPGDALDDATVSVPSAPIRAISIVGKC